MHLQDRHRPITAPSLHYRQLLARAAGLGFISSPRRSPRRRIVDGMLARGFRKPKIVVTEGGALAFRAYYGAHLVTPTFYLNRDGSIPDQTILAALCKTADRMDARRPGKKKSASASRAVPLAHPIYVFHGNEQPKLHELVTAFPPEGGMKAYVADMSATGAFAEGIKDAA